MKNTKLFSFRRDSDDYCINWYLKQRRLDRGITCQELAKLSGVSKSAIHSYEQLRVFPKIENARKIAEVLETKVENIFPEELKELRRKFNTGNNFKYVGARLSEIEEELDKVGILYRRAIDQNYQDALREGLESVMQKLDNRERQIISLRFGLNGNSKMLLREIGNIFGLTRERVRQIEKEAICKLRQLKEALEDFYYLE